MEKYDVQAEVCLREDLHPGEMREVAIGDGKALLVRNEDGSFCAFGSKCTHQGESLIKGIFRNGRIRCPRHGACFNSKTGDIEDYPGLDSLPKHDVTITDSGKVIVRTNKQAIEAKKRVKSMLECRIRNEDEPGVVIIGGGASAITCSETLRQEGFGGRITIISKSQLLPYDRPVMTKDLSAKIEDLYLRSDQFFQENEIEFRLRKEVSRINPEKKSVCCADGENISYDKLMICTGLKVRRLNFPGAHLENIFVLSTPMDANHILEKARGKRLVVIGASFMGMEIVSCLNKFCKHITVCCRTSVPFERSFGKEVGAGLQKIHERKGVDFRMQSNIVEFGGTNTVQYVVLENGDTIETDMVVAGVGVDLTTGFLEGSGIEMDEMGYVMVDRNLHTNLSDVYAAGAIARFPIKCYGYRRVNIEHWQMAHYLGKIVALNMLQSSSQRKDLAQVESIPFFWTEQYGAIIQYTGIGEDYDDVIIKGDVSEGHFSAFYAKEHMIIAVATMKSDPVASLMAQRLLAGEELTVEDMKRSLDLQE